jgi:hypothetical protein
MATACKPVGAAAHAWCNRCCKANHLLCSCLRRRPAHDAHPAPVDRTTNPDRALRHTRLRSFRHATWLSVRCSSAGAMGGEHFVVDHSFFDESTRYVLRFGRCPIAHRFRRRGIKLRSAGGTTINSYDWLSHSCFDFFNQSLSPQTHQLVGHHKGQ